MKKELVKFLVLLAVALGAGPAGAALWQWSLTPSSNATADPTINWSPGMSPSSVSPSARAMMTAIKQYSGDISGVLSTSGTSTAYAVTTFSGNTPATPPTGYHIAIRPFATNGALPTLSVDGGTAYPIQSVVGTGLGAATIIAGSPYTLMFNGSAWMLRDFFSDPYSVPLGSIIQSVASTPPNSNYVLPYGQCISRTVYAEFFAMVGTTYGACDGVTEFAVPDMRGRIPTGLDNMGGSNSNRITYGCGGPQFITLGLTCGQSGWTLSTSNLPPYTPSGTNSVPSFNPPQAYFGPFGGGAGGLAFMTGAGGASGFASVASATPGSVSAPNFTGNAQGGTSTPFPTLPPVIGVNYFLRVL